MKWMNNARIVAIFAVVMLHVAAYPVLNAELGSNTWWVANIYDSALRWCVPIFVMISGALLLEPRQEGLSSFYRKRAARVLLPLLFWSAFYLLWAKLKHGAYGNDPSEIDIWERLSAGKPYFHLWFLYMLVFLYLFAPFFQKMIQSCKPKHLHWVVLCGFALAALNAALTKMEDTSSSWFFNWFLLYIPYFLLGHVIRHMTLNIPRRWLWLGLMSCIVATASGVYALAMRTDLSTGTYFYDNLSITVIPMSACIILLLRDWNHSLITSQFTHTLSKLTLGVYLLHPIVLDIAYYFDINAITFNPLWSIPVLSLLTYGISLGLVAGLQRTPLRHTL
ncbi:acyltransferase [Alcaligenes endophyticus]|uniref:Acyltransferase family protein n=1 Tax=Alcaligenes endophyticus TaxID=1929088 RepID=A0ABT8EFE1_9BURK|nr:acyltransferase family protein [Alcaligenes endophyticus]MCX5590409.1 acyltransferase family protein [Alcaligenes endophyticus]MDN4119927.1 acyltransferase family protein [Alcaligenes endophyticus]